MANHSQRICVALRNLGAEFVQLEMRDGEAVEAALMEELSVPACTSEPGGDGRLPVAEDAFGGGRVEPFGQRRQHPCDLLRRGFQPVQRGVASRTERGATGLTTERLDALGTALLAIANQRVDVSIGDPEVRTLLVGTSEARGGYALGGSSAAFHLTPGAYWCTGGSHIRRRRAGETAGRTVQWRAWLEQTVHPGAHNSCFEGGRLKMEPIKTPKQHQKEGEKENEQEHEHMKSHNDPRCLKWGEGRAPF
jgi:hypothetical protein